MAPETERASLIRDYINTQNERDIRERERERDIREREQEQGIPESQRAAVILEREKTKQMKLLKDRPTMIEKSREGASYFTIFIITIDTV